MDVHGDGESSSRRQGPLRGPQPRGGRWPLGGLKYGACPPGQARPAPGPAPGAGAPRGQPGHRPPRPRSTISRAPSNGARSGARGEGASLPHGPAQGLGADGRVQGQEVPPGDAEGPLLGPEEGPRGPLRLQAQEVRGPGHQSGGAPHRAPVAGSDLLQQGQHLQPEAVTGEAGVEVGGIFAPVLAAGAEGRAQGLPLQLKEGTGQAQAGALGGREGGAGAHPAQGPGAPPAEERQEHRLYLVVQGVPGGHGGGAGLPADVPQEGVAHVAGRPPPGRGAGRGRGPGRRRALQCGAAPGARRDRPPTPRPQRRRPPASRGRGGPRGATARSSRSQPCRASSRKTESAPPETATTTRSAGAKSPPATARSTCPPGRPGVGSGAVAKRGGGGHRLPRTGPQRALRKRSIHSSRCPNESRAGSTLPVPCPAGGPWGPIDAPWACRITTERSPGWARLSFSRAAVST